MKRRAEPPGESEEHTQGSRASASSKLEAASALQPGLYIVSTPIGNLGDMSARAALVLGAVDLVLCEDTRITGGLLHRSGIRNRLFPYHEHNAAAVREGLLARLAGGQRMALASDAGTPCIADPGYKLVRSARDLGIAIHSVPGPSAVTAALSVSGLPTDRFFFQGFLPSRRAARRTVLEELASIPATVVCYESPRRLVASLEDALELMGDRPAALARELTKLHEEVKCGTLATLRDHVTAETRLRGEIVLVIGSSGEGASPIDEHQIEQLLRDTLAELGPGKAAAQLSRLTGRSRQDLYRMALRLKRE